MYNNNESKLYVSKSMKKKKKKTKNLHMKNFFDTFTYLLPETCHNLHTSKQ